ncbi:MAG: hypothetical protein C0631_06255 [Sedimenticola sp.]|nr:MAG: hypothetical protein C0631_06255 [Sedimenticola sp.]
MSDFNEQLIELETKVAFQAHTIEVLNDTVIAQQKRIEVLEKGLAELRQQMKQITPPETDNAGNEPPPPHY